MRSVLGVFSIDDSLGATAILEGRSNLPIGKELRAEIHVPGRPVIKARAYKAWPDPRPYENYFFVGVNKADLIDGAAVTLELCGD